MKVFFDLSLEEKWHRLEWEARLAEAASGNTASCAIVTSRAAADVVFVTREPESRAALLKRSDVETLVWSSADHPVGRYSGFYCSLPRNTFDARRHRTFCYPIVHNEQVDCFPLEDARVDAGFMGGITAPIRKKIVDSLAASTQISVDVKIQGGPWDALFDRSGITSKREYAEHLRRSRFVICPRGNGVGSVRMFEVMQASRVPVIISDQYVLPSNIAWDTCALVVKEKQASDLERIIADKQERWPILAARARQIWEKHFSAPAWPTELGALLEHINANAVYAPAPFAKQQVASIIRSGARRLVRAVT